MMADLDALMNAFENAVDDGGVDDGGYTEGASVEAKYRGGNTWYRGKVESLNDDGTINVKYLDGEREENMKRTDVRLLDVPKPEATAAKPSVNITSPKPSNSPARGSSAPSPKAAAVALAPAAASQESQGSRESHAEDEIRVMSEDELRALSRNTTEDRNLATVASSADAPLDSREARSSRSKATVQSAHAAHSSKGSASHHDQSLTATLTAPLKNPLDDTDNFMSTAGFDGEEEEDGYADYAGQYEDEDEDDEGEAFEERPGTAGSSDFNPDGTLRRKPYQSALSKPFIKAGGTVISAAQARLFGLTGFKGARKELDPDASAKQQLKRIHNLTHVKPKDLSYIKSEDDIESTFKPAKSAEALMAMRHPKLGYDFVDRLAAEKDGFLQRAEAGKAKSGKAKKAEKDQAEQDYISSHDKLACPKCKKAQSFDQFWDKKRECMECNLRFIKVNVSSLNAFERRNKIAAEKREKNIHEIEQSVYGRSAFKPNRPKDPYLDLKADMQELFLAIFEPRQEGTVYLRDADQALSAIAKAMQRSPNFLILSKKTQREMTSAAITGFLEMDSLFSKYVRYDAATKRKVLTDWRESPDFSIPITGMTTLSRDAQWSGDQGAPPPLGEDEQKLLREQRLKRAQSHEAEAKSKADYDRKRPVKPAQSIMVPADENKGAARANRADAKESKDDADQVRLLKQLAKLNEEKANLLNATLAAAEQRTKENKDFVEATKASKLVGNSADARPSSTAGNGSGRSASKSRPSSEQAAQKKVIKSREAKSAKPSALNANANGAVDKFDALLNW